MASEQTHINATRHSLAHILAFAILKKYPKAKLGIGPAIDTGFYYDIKFPKPVSEEILPVLEQSMRNIIAEKLPMKGEKITPAKACSLFKDQPFKLDLIKDFAKEKKQLTAYHTGKFTDLCKGGHIKNTSEINPDAFTLVKIAGAYWKGNEKNPQLTRIYGAAFSTKEELQQYMWQQEEAKKRDHRILGERLKLFTFAKEVGPGLPLWLPRGTIIRDVIEERAKKIEQDWGYQRVATPHIAKEDLYKISGHIPYYANDMYPPMKLDDGNYYLKGMNCPHTHMIYKAEPHSYRDLPLRYAEYGTVYRHELSGTLSGLLRVRGFTQNDAHIYCQEDQVEEEFLNVMNLHKFWYNLFGIKDYYVRLSLPAKNKKKYAGETRDWNTTVEMIKKIMQKSGIPFVEAEDEAAFYGPKADFQVKSVVGTEYTASTNQLDFLAAKRFELTYVDTDGREKPVYVIHRAPLGSHERFIAFLIEHYTGVFPFWLSPVQSRILTINEKVLDYAKEVEQELKKNNIRVELDSRNESLGKKIREAEMQKIPYLLVIGEKEKSARTLNVRVRGKGDVGEKSLSMFLSALDVS
ncbi:MAG: threonyl-tRNA synthetase [Parcubacteria group bacterium Gr01-1014_70]|nr:MAG: threonyl-tRNA synthetase [Parcubacteria group bacterium Gr01-1014_70]